MEPLSQKLVKQWITFSGFRRIHCFLSDCKSFQNFALDLYNAGMSIGNAILIYAVYADVRMRTATNMLIASQAIADLGTSILVMPFALISVVADG